jgi:Branched-chain amino acid transport protein (AzlD)
MTDFWPYIVLILVGFLPNEVWRMLGIIASHGIDEGSELIIWVRAVATAILTGVVGKLVVFAPGALATVPVTVRIGSAALGVVAFLLIRRSVFAGVATATLAIVAGVLVFGG